MTRTIRLTCIHALNWYGYKDSIPMQGNTLLAGVTGSGKSILMDLIQYVLVGDQRLVRFNQSATGDRSERTVKGYCLGDTKEDDNGVTQYLRQSAITYCALEFTWPKNNRMETWGVRIEFSSAAEIHGRVTPFHFPCSLRRGDFLDDKKVPLDYLAFKALVDRYAGRLYTEGLDAYLRDMAQPHHLNFERSLLKTLLPTAMSFTFLRSFNEFCRQFILPADKLDVSDVTASYKAFLVYERELSQLNDQFVRLREIKEMFENLTRLRRDALLGQYLDASLLCEYAAELEAMQQVEFDEAKKGFEAEQVRLQELDEFLPEMRTRLDTVKTSINAIPAGQLYNELTSQREKLLKKIGALDPIGSTLQEALSYRVRKARNWQSLLTALPFEFDADITSKLEQAILAVEAGGLQRADQTLIALTEVSRTAATEAARRSGPQLNRLSEIRNELDALRGEIAALKLGKLPFPTRLLDALNSRLKKRGSQLPARHMREVCEISDEEWRPAIEVAFARKFAILVAPEDYDQAEIIYHSLGASELGRETGRESLINPVKALKLKRTVQAGSLAEKIITADPVGAAVVSHFFGNLMCVKRREQLREHEFAILSDGFMSRGAFVERPRFYDGLPYIGKGGLERQLAWKQKQAEALKLEERQLEPLALAMEGIANSFSQTFDVEPNLHRDLAQTRELPQLKSDLRELTMRLDAIDRSSFAHLAKEQEQLALLVLSSEQEQRQLERSPKRARVAVLEKTLRELHVEALARKEKFERVRNATDISPWLKQLEELRTGVFAEYPVKDVAARYCGTLFNQADKDASVALETLRAKRRELALVHPKFEDLPIEPEENDAHLKQFIKLQESDIPNYRQKAERERTNWEDLFRTQVLEKLHSALGSIRDLLFLLNNTLKQHPIGTSRYQIRHNQNRDFTIYHDLVSANALARPGELFFASAEPRFRDAITHFLSLLTDKGETVEAARLLDYRQYYEYDMEVVEEDGRKTSVDRHSGKFSGGENQSPYFIAILASYLRAYLQYRSRKQEPSIGLVPIDEAFSKLSGERIKDCMEAIKAFDLQGVFSMSTGNIPYAFEHCNSLVIVSKEERRIGNRTAIRNIPVTLACDSDEARRIMGSPSHVRRTSVVAGS
jgi:hypothetical protein